MALEPNRQTKGIRFEIVKFFTLLLLLREKTGCRYAKKLRKITPHAQTSTALVWFGKLNRASGGMNPFIPVRFMIFIVF